MDIVKHPDEQRSSPSQADIDAEGYLLAFVCDEEFIKNDLRGEVPYEDRSSCHVQHIINSSILGLGVGANPYKIHCINDVHELMCSVKIVNFINVGNAVHATATRALPVHIVLCTLWNVYFNQCVQLIVHMNQICVL